MASTPSPSPSPSPSTSLPATFCDLLTEAREMEGPELMPATERARSLEATEYCTNLWKWYQRMISPNIGFVASHANEQSQRWSSAILKKKSAMQTMLEAQRIIEDIEMDLSNFLDQESIQHMRSMFFYDVLSTSLDGKYLLQLEKVSIRSSVSENSAA